MSRPASPFTVILSSRQSFSFLAMCGLSMHFANIETNYGPQGNERTESKTASDVRNTTAKNIQQCGSCHAMKSDGRSPSTHKIPMGLFMVPFRRKSLGQFIFPLPS